MTLQSKTLLIIGLTFVGLIAVLYAASQLIVLNSFAQQEEQNTRKNIERVQSAFDDNLKSLESTTRDWSLWDDTYRYIQDKNQAFYDANLANGLAMTNHQLNLMLFVDEHAHVVFEQSYDYQADMRVPSPPGLLKYIYNGSPLLSFPSSESSITGFLALPESPMLVAAEPILPSSGMGIMKGTLIFGRLLDNDQTQHLARITNLSLSFVPADSAALPADFASIRPLLIQDPGQNQAIEVRALDQDTIAGYTVLRDVFGKPGLILRAATPRDIYMRGLDTIHYYMFTLAGVGLVFGLVILLLLKRMILSRLAHLDLATSSIAASGDASARVVAGGSDELSHLAVSMNQMLSALQRTHEELKESEERYRAVIEQTTEAIFLVDTETHKFVQSNAASQVLLGYSQEELETITLDQIVESNEDTTGHLTSRLHAGTTGNLRVATERKYRRKDESVVPVEVSDSHITYGGRDVVCLVVRDITDRKRAEVILRDLAMRDGLTGLYNRREMQRALKEGVECYQRYEESAALLLIDLDHFKSVNDTYGHQVGDDVLRWIAQMLGGLVRSSDKVARYGGEELAVIMPGADIETAIEVAERVRCMVASQPVELTQSGDDNERKVVVPITVSIGVAALTAHISNIESLVEAADQALYEAKRNGRNCTVAYRTISPSLRAI